MKSIIHHELLTHIKSFHFSILLALSIILFAGNGIIYSKSFAEQNSAYQKRQANLKKEISTVIIGLYRHPNSLCFIADGGQQFRSSAYSLLPKGTYWAERPNSRSFKLPIVPAIDWSFIIGTIFSLYTILLGYQSISGEKNQGTLRLILSNSVGRVRLLIEKYFAILLSIMIPLLLGMLVSLIINGIMNPEIFRITILMRIGLVLLLSTAYVSLFAFLSILFSTVIQRSSVVLLVLLAVWVMFAMVIPSSSGILIEKLSSAPREINTFATFRTTIKKEIVERINKIAAEAERGKYKNEKELKDVTDRAYEEGQALIRQFNDDFRKSNRARTNKAKILSRISPMALFNYATEAIVQSGDIGEDRFISQLHIYSHIYDAYIHKKIGKVVEMSQWSFSQRIIFNGKPMLVRSPEPMEYEGDKSDFPIFFEQEPTIDIGIKDALFDFAGLLFWNIFLAALAYISIVKMDVR